MPLKHVHRVRSKGRVYYYHRPSKTKIEAAWGTPAFVLELAAAEKAHAATLTAKAAAQPPQQDDGAPEKGTLGFLIWKYRQPTNPSFANLGKRTKLEYLKILDWLHPGRNVKVALIDTPHCMALRDKAFEQHGRHFANEVLEMLSVLFNWGAPHGITTSNPARAEACPRVKRPRNAPRANRPFRPAELLVCLRRSKGVLRVAIALAAFAGLRKSDLVEYQVGQYRGKEVMTRQEKTGDWVWMPAYSVLQRILDDWLKKTHAHAPGADPARAVLITRKGTNLTYAGLNTLWQRFRRGIQKKHLVQKGLTLHGLRHTFGTTLKELGLDDTAVAKLMGHTDERSTKRYTRMAATTVHVERGMELLEQSSYGKARRRGSAP